MACSTGYSISSWTVKQSSFCAIALYVTECNDPNARTKLIANRSSSYAIGYNFFSWRKQQVCPSDSLKWRSFFHSIPAVENPSCRQTTLASIKPHPLSHTVPHIFLLQTSTRPSRGVRPLTSLISPSVQPIKKVKSTRC